MPHRERRGPPSSLQLFFAESGGVLPRSEGGDSAEAQGHGLLGLIFIRPVVNLGERGFFLHGARVAQGLGGEFGSAPGALQGSRQYASGNQTEFFQVEPDAARPLLLHERQVGAGAHAGGRFSGAEGVAVAGDDQRSHGSGR